MTGHQLMQKHRTYMTTVFMSLLLLLALAVIPSTKARAQGEKSGINNLTYTLTATNGAAVSTKANPGETTVLVFDYVGCGKTRSTLDSLIASEWIKRSDIRIIYVDAQGYTQEEVLEYEQGYQCPYITFCADDKGINMEILYNYGQLFGAGSRGSFPSIVLIDGENKVQNFLQGTKTANEILSEIKKFADIDAEGTTPPDDSEAGIPNYAFALKSIDDEVVSTKTNPGENTVLVFGYTTCGITKGTLKEIWESSWVSRSDIRVIFAEVYGASKSEVADFAGDYPGKNILFCHDEDGRNYNFALRYLGLYNQTGGKFPYIVLIDKNNKIRNITVNYRSAEDIIKEIDSFSKEEPTEPSEPEPSVPKVSGFKAASTAKEVKLTWKKVAKADGYIVYQYNDAKKKWDAKTTLTTNKASHTVKKLKPASEYRFAVKAFVEMKDGKKALSKSYVSLYTATAPNAVKLSAAPGKKKVTLKWKKVTGATGYVVSYKTKANGAWKKLKDTKGTSYTKTKLKSGSSYFFKVEAYKSYKGKTYPSSFTSKKVKIK